MRRGGGGVSQLERANIGRRRSSNAPAYQRLAHLNSGKSQAIVLQHDLAQSLEFMQFAQVLADIGFEFHVAQAYFLHTTMKFGVL